MKHFRFLDLAAELRNKIYEYSLLHDRENRRTANVALLRVSKQVHAEAGGIFHELSTFNLHVTSSFQDGHLYEIELQGGITVKMSEKKSSVLDIYQMFTQSMRKVHKMNVHLHLIQYSEWDGNTDVWELGAVRFMYAFTNFLSVGGAHPFVASLLS